MVLIRECNLVTFAGRGMNLGRESLERSGSVLCQAGRREAESRGRGLPVSSAAVGNPVGRSLGAPIFVPLLCAFLIMQAAPEVSTGRMKPGDAYRM